MNGLDKKMQLNWNGLFVTTQRPGRTVPQGSCYRGAAYGRPWPLSPHSSAQLLGQIRPEEKNLIERVWNDVAPAQNPSGCLASESPDVLADLFLAREYVLYCTSRQVSVRALLCATPSPRPLLDPEDVQSLLTCSRHLGYDYWDGWELSAIWDIAAPELSRFSTRLNSFGLFDELDDLEDYISSRRQVSSSLDLEVSTWMPTDVWEISAFR